MSYPGMQRSIAVFVKANGVLVACRAYPQPDGAVWQCAICSTVIIRATYGVLNGLYRCTCGCYVEMLVDGQTVEIEYLNDLPQEANPESAPQPQGQINDEEFLRGLRIVPDLATTEE